MVRTLFVGIDGERVVGGEETRRQIEEVKKLRCALEYGGRKLDWDAFDDPREPRTIFQAILRDRKMRVDMEMLMADRPPFAVVTARGGDAVRLEYYQGHDALSLVHDIRAPELQGQNLPAFLEEDPCAYDPAECLEKLLGIPKEMTGPILEKAHETKET